MSGFRVGDAHGLFQKRRHGLPHLSKAAVISGPGIFMMCAREVQISEIMNRNNESMEIIDNYSLIIGMAAISG